MKKKFLVILLSFISIQFSLYSKETKVCLPSLEPLFELHNAEGFLENSQNSPGRDFLRLALNFSLVEQNSPDMDSYLQKFDELEKNIFDKSFNQKSDSEKAALILQRMYELQLKEYEADQSRVDVLLDKGIFNCVTASVLYISLGMDAGLELYCCSLENHCFCRVKIDGKFLNVECTSRNGFDVGDREIVFGKITFGECEGSSPVAALYDLANNMCLSNDFAHDFQIPYLVALYELTKNDSFCEPKSRKWLEFAVNSFFYELYQDQRIQEALAWVEKDDWVYLLSDSLRENYSIVITNKIVELYNVERFQEARAVLEQYADKLTEERLKMAQGIFYAVDLYESLCNMDAEEGIPFLLELMEQDVYAQTDVQQVVESWYVYFISVLMSRQECYEAALIATESRKVFPKNKDLEEFEEAAWYDFDVSVHNEYVALKRQKRFEEAKEVLSAGLERHPQSKILKRDAGK